MVKHDALPTFNGELKVENGEIKNDISIIHARSLAENIKVYDVDHLLFTGDVTIEEGSLADDEDVIFQGNSLIHSAPLTAEAFTRSFMGEWGRYVVTFGLLFFAFSTSLAWAYYAGRSVHYLVGEKWVLLFRLVYCASFFFAAFVDTSIAWVLSGVTIALMALPNLIGLLLLRKDMKKEVAEYWVRIKKEFPNVK